MLIIRQYLLASFVGIFLCAYKTYLRFCWVISQTESLRANQIETDFNLILGVINFSLWCILVLFSFSSCTAMLKFPDVVMVKPS